MSNRTDQFSTISSVNCQFETEQYFHWNLYCLPRKDLCIWNIKKRRSIPSVNLSSWREIGCERVRWRRPEMIFLRHACTHKKWLPFHQTHLWLRVFVRVVRTVKGVRELFYRLIRVIIHLSQVEAQGGQRCIPAVASRAGGLDGSCLAQCRGWSSEGEAALLGGRWIGRGRTGVEWKLAPHYLQLLVHSLMIKCWRSICSETVRAHGCVRSRVWAYVCKQTSGVCLIRLF